MIKPIYGVMAEFDNPTALVNAARAAREKGYRRLDAYSPFPIHGMERALRLSRSKVPAFVFVVLFIALLIAYPWYVLTIGTVCYLVSLPAGALAYRRQQQRYLDARAQGAPPQQPANAPAQSFQAPAESEDTDRPPHLH